MSWLEELSAAMARTVIELATKYEGASLLTVQNAVEVALDNLKTAEMAADYFRDLSSVTPKEAAFLRSTTRNLVMEAAANLLMYWVALGCEEQKEDDKKRTGTHCGI